MNDKKLSWPSWLFSLGIWFACFIVWSIGSMSLRLSPLLLALVIAPWLPEYIKQRTLQVTTGKVIWTVLLFFGSLSTLWTTYREHNYSNAQVSHDIQSQQTWVIEENVPTQSIGEIKAQDKNLQEKQFQSNIDLNKKIFYLNSIAEYISIHKYDEKYWVWNELVNATEIRKNTYNEYFDKLMSSNQIDLNYAHKIKDEVIMRWVTENRSYPCVHNNEVYNAYLSQKEYTQRKNEIKQSQDKEKNEITRNLWKTGVILQCTLDY